MPRNKVSAIKEKSVLVTVYVEVPRKRRLITNKGQNNHHQRHLFAYEKARPRGWYNRRAELLEYSRRLRESARLRQTPVQQLQPKPADSLQRSKSQIKERWEENYQNWPIYQSKNDKNCKKLTGSKNWRIFLQNVWLYRKKEIKASL